MSNTIKVLKIGGKNEDIYKVSVHEFSSLQDANIFVEGVNVGENNQKYWFCAKIIEVGQQYEMQRYEISESKW